MFSGKQIVIWVWIFKSVHMQFEWTLSLLEISCRGLQNITCFNAALFVLSPRINQIFEWLKVKINLKYEHVMLFIGTGSQAGIVDGAELNVDLPVVSSNAELRRHLTIFSNTNTAVIQSQRTLNWGILSRLSSIDMTI
jgi:hypothetical protein